MQNFRRCSLWLFIATVAVLAAESPVQAYYGHRNYRSGRGYNRNGNRLAGMQRSIAAANASQARMYSAQMNLVKQTRLARQQAEQTSGLASAKSDHVQAERDYQTAKMNVVDNLKKNNPEFNQLQQQSRTLRQQVLKLKNSTASGSGDLGGVESQLKSNARRMEQIESDAVNNDSSVKEILARQVSSHTAELAAQKELQNAISQNPAVKAAQQQLMQASQLARLAANRYGNSMTSGYGGGYGRHRGYGYGRGYHASYGTGYHVRQVRHVHHRRR